MGLEATTNDNLTLEDMIRMTMRVGDMAVQVMKTLDEANTSTYKDPSPHKVNVNIKKGPFIIVSGHDLKDLEMLLKQTEGKGINIYTHGEMLPANGYPELKNTNIWLEILDLRGKISKKNLMEFQDVF